ncbi:MAG: BolA family transcriptional regulator [Alphaproteobacteria bacterium]|nr:BolA family transcriptional regulator [Alphaproteobacteria bacterium]
MIVQQGITEKLQSALTPSHLDVINESHMHNVPPGSESHFKVVIVSDQFDGLPRIKRHQTVNGVLSKELREDIHALSMTTLTPAEWIKRGGKVLDSPQCHGGGENS